ncbi:MAG: insulinase family protein [Bacteroidales bacterium]|nr:MAG: insulinase family protein [Bacteroidales bacterium]
MDPVDRKKIPPLHLSERIDYIRDKKVTLSNGIPVYLINAGNQDILRIELLLSAGSWVEPGPLIASSTNDMLNEGTKTRTAEMIAESFDYYGSYLHLNANKDTAGVVLFTLSKYLEETLVIVADIIQNSTFPEREFATYIQKKKQQFVEEREKVRYLARTGFLRSIFGQLHPYGREILLEDFTTVTAKQLSEFHCKCYLSDSIKIIVTGKIPKGIETVFEKHFGDWDLETIETRVPEPIPVVPADPSNIFLEKENVVQSAIRIGKKLFNKHHPDYHGVQVLNTVLGGYFGSRLMRNIREEKGYTYGIGSAFISLHHAGFFTIASEVGTNVCRSAVKEIYKEIKILREQIIPEEELSMVRNYLLGQVIRMFDGPFALAESFRAILEYGLDYSHYDNAIRTIRNISAKDLRDLANRYLGPESMTEIVAGKY